MISIYKITSPLYPNKIYIGSTKNAIEERFLKHKNKYKRWLNKKAHADYIYSFPLLKYGTIELLETCDEKDRYQRELINIIIAKTIMKCINRIYPLCRLKCRQKINNQSEKTKLYQKNWRQSDKGKLSMKLYGKIYSQSDKCKLTRKNYASKKVTCPICNSIVVHTYLSKHQKRKKCKSFISKQL